MTMAAITAALVERLSGDSELLAADVSVYTHVPAGAGMPYLLLGEITLEPEPRWGGEHYGVQGTIRFFASGESPYSGMPMAEAAARCLSGAVSVMEEGTLYLEQAGLHWQSDSGSIAEIGISWSGRWAP